MSTMHAALSMSFSHVRGDVSGVSMLSWQGYGVCGRVSGGSFRAFGGVDSVARMLRACCKYAIPTFRPSPEDRRFPTTHYVHIGSGHGQVDMVNGHVTKPEAWRIMWQCVCYVGWAMFCEFARTIPFPESDASRVRTFHMQPTRSGGVS